MSKGFFTIAQGEQYQRMAYALALSLKISQPLELSNLSVGMTKEEIENINPKYKEVFHNIVEIPWKDHAANSSWKLENEWKSIYMTPYKETIKLDADMLFTTDISAWWDLLSHTDCLFSTQPVTYRSERITSDFYRKCFTENDLPNIYTALFYFKNTPKTIELFKLAEVIFNNWERFYYEFLKSEHRPKHVATDEVFALACKILGIENEIDDKFFTFVHMKSRLQNWPEDAFMTEQWTQVVTSSLNSKCDLKISNVVQTVPFHYYDKAFLTTAIIETLESKLGI